MKEKKFITSPTDIEAHHKADLRDATVDEESKQQFKALCTQYQVVFFVDSCDIGKAKQGSMDR